MPNNLALFTSGDFIVPLLQIIWLDLLLSGDNAVVIALACRGLPPERRKLGAALGAGAAIVLRVVLAVFITLLLDVPYLKLAGALLLAWVAVKLMLPQHEGEEGVEAKSSLWGAIGTIMIADAVMSLDNVIAIAAASGGNVILLVLGLLISIPLIVFGSQIVMRALDRLPILAVFGAGLLGWIAGEIAMTDPAVQSAVEELPHWSHYAASAAGALLVILIGWLLAQWRRRRSPA